MLNIVLLFLHSSVGMGKRDLSAEKGDDVATTENVKSMYQDGLDEIVSGED